MSKLLFQYLYCIFVEREFDDECSVDCAILCILYTSIFLARLQIKLVCISKEWDYHDY